MTISCLNIQTFLSKLVITIKTLNPSQPTYDYLIWVGHKFITNFFMVTTRWWSLHNIFLLVKRKNAGTHLITSATAAIAQPAPPALTIATPAAARRAPRLKSVPASRAWPKAPRKSAGDPAKNKHTRKRTNLPPVASELHVLDAPLVDDIAANKVVIFL
jgi:hypothetical protein